jgi:hypothetical protein
MWNLMQGDMGKSYIWNESVVKAHLPYIDGLGNSGAEKHALEPRGRIAEGEKPAGPAKVLPSDVSRHGLVHRSVAHDSRDTRGPSRDSHDRLHVVALQELLDRLSVDECARSEVGPAEEEGEHGGSGQLQCSPAER